MRPPAGWMLVAVLLVCTLAGGAFVGFVDLWVIFRKPRRACPSLPGLHGPAPLLAMLAEFSVLAGPCMSQPVALEVHPILDLRCPACSHALPARRAALAILRGRCLGQI